MSTNFGDEYQYNSCVSRGVCSTNPKTASMQEILVMYLADTAYYILKLKNFGYENKQFKDFILDTISIMVSNPEFSEKDFYSGVNKFKSELPGLIKKYKSVCQENNIKPEIRKTTLEYKKQTDIVKSIRLGEKMQRERIKKLTPELRNLYKILFLLLKSVCINILTLESYGVDSEAAYAEILTILNSLDQKSSEEEIRELVINASKTDNKLMLKIIKIMEERYGKPAEKLVPYSTSPSKAILVVGSNLRELENILEAVKNEQIDVYSHDEMILAHSYPKFQEYKNFKGQFGHGYENCLLDFSTFPGPIVLTRHSLFNIENLYRGRLYTTDKSYSKGVIPLNNNDYSEVIKSANRSKGFKNGKDCKSELSGFNIDFLKKQIQEKVSKGNFSKIIIIEPWDSETNEYISNLFSKISGGILLLLLAPVNVPENENIITVNACFNALALVSIVDSIEDIIKENNMKLTVFIPKCDRYTVSKMIYLSSVKNFSVYFWKCSPKILNPSVILSLKNTFNIKFFGSVRQDLKNIAQD